MTEQMACPNCNADWRGKPIPKEHRHMFGNATHFKREIGIYDRDKDRTVALQCPDCKATFDRGTFKPVHHPWGAQP